MPVVNLEELERQEKEIDAHMGKLAAGNTDAAGADGDGKTSTEAPGDQPKPNGDGSEGASKAVEGDDKAGATPAKKEGEEAVPPAETVPKAQLDQVQGELIKAQEALRFLQVKYNNENAPLMRRVAELEKALAAAKETKPAPVAAPATAEAKKRLAEHFASDDAVKDMDAVTAAHVLPLMEKIQQLEQTVTALQGGVARAAETSYDARFFSIVKPEIHARLNADPAFKAWMGEEEGNSGQTRMQVATRWYEQGNPDRVAVYYTDYMKKNEGAGTPPADPPKGEGAGKKPVPSKAALIEPKPTPKGGEPKGDAGPEEVKESEIIQLGRDVQAGKYKGREAELEALMAKHDAARAAGRIKRGQ